MPKHDLCFLFMQNMPKHELLTIEEEAHLSKRVQDWVLLQNKLKDLGKKLERPPSFSEWAKAAKMCEPSFQARLNDGNKVCIHMHQDLGTPPSPATRHSKIAVIQ